MRIEVLGCYGNIIRNLINDNVLLDELCGHGSTR